MVQMLRPWELHINLDFKNDKAIYLQIADAIVEAIKSGQLKSNDYLPGTRKLAKLLKVNRNTIVKALDLLLIEGWLTSVERKGIFVSNLASLKQNQSNAKGYEEKNLAFTSPQTASIIFDDGAPDTKLAPIDDLAKAYREIFGRKGRRQMMGYTEANGDALFREALSQMLNFNRNLTTKAEQIIVTRGSQMAMYLIAHSLFNQGDYVIVENPGYKPAWLAFQSAGATLIPVTVDGEGIVIDDMIEVLKKQPIKAIYITPHHQFPTTVSLSLQRRYKLIELSQQYGFSIIEDDYDHDFHFAARPIFPIGSLADIENYIYIGTLSKIVAPALRIGYLYSTQRDLVDKIIALRKIIDIQGDTMMEQAVLELINNGTIKRHLKRATLNYLRKRDYFEMLLKQHLDFEINFQKPTGGLAYWLQPKKKIDIFKLANQLENKGIKILTPDKFSFNEPIMGLRLGFASLSEEELEIGIKNIALLLKQL